MSIGESMDLLTALYLRHCTGLDPRTDPVIPPLEPEPPPVRPLPPAQAEIVSAQWVLWWGRLLLAAGQRQQPPWPLPATAADTPELADLPELREVVSARLPDPDFPVWLGARQREEADFMTGRTRPELNAGGLVAQLAGVRRRPARPFRLVITVIPVESTQGWRLAPEHLLMTRSVLADAAAFRALVEPVIAELT